MKTDRTHRTKDGREMRLSEMTTEHLRNTIAWIRRRAEEGVVVASGAWAFDDDGFCYDEELLTGWAALEHMGLADYVAELKRRNTNGGPCTQ